MGGSADGKSRRKRVPRPERLSAIDAHVGSRVRLRRALLGLSQTELGMKLGLTFQQIQKYERGTNSVAAGRLWQLAEALDVPVSFFFDGMPGADAPNLQPEEPGIFMPPLGRRETLELARCYYRLKDPRLRRRVFDMVRFTVEALERAVT